MTVENQSLEDYAQSLKKLARTEMQIVATYGTCNRPKLVENILPGIVAKPELKKDTGWGRRELPKPAEIIEAVRSPGCF